MPLATTPGSQGASTDTAAGGRWSGHDAATTSSSSSTALSAPGAGQTHARPLPTLPVAQRRSAGAPVPAAAGQAGHAPAREATADRAAAATVRPTLGANPLRPAAPAGRDGTSGGHAGASAGSADAPVAARWAADTVLPATVRSLPEPASSGTSGEAVPLQRLSEPNGSAADSPLAQAPVPMREIVFPALGAPGTASFPPTSSGGPTLPAGFTGGAGPIPAQGHVQRQLPGSAAPGPLRSMAGGMQGETGDPSRELPLSRPARAGTARHSDPVTTSQVQRLVTAAAAGAAPGPTTSAPVAQRSVVFNEMETSVSTSGGSTPDPVTNEDLDRLARDLFGRIRNRLRTEVILEREAKGLSFDSF